MKKVKIINNPSSGKLTIRKQLDIIIMTLINRGYTVSRYDTKKKDDAKNETIKAAKEDWDLIVASGGDGTINEVANGIVVSERKIPVAIHATGTVNDFSNYLKLPNNPKEFCDMIDDFILEDVDLGKANGTYFINVVSGGMLTNVAHTVPSESKNLFGKAAYYVEGLKEVPKHVNTKNIIKISSDEYNKEEDISLFLITNSSSIGGFKKLAPYADIKDGLLDCVIIGKTEIQNLVPLFFSIVRGEHVENASVKYFKTKKVFIESVDTYQSQVDADGELIGELPLTVEVVEKAFRIIVPKEEI